MGSKNGQEVRLSDKEGREGFGMTGGTEKARRGLSAWRRGLSLVCGLLLAAPVFGVGESSFLVQPDVRMATAVPFLAPTPLPALGPPPFDAWPMLDAEGFLAPGAAEDPFVHIDTRAGQWVYCSRVLRVEIARHSAKVNKRNLVWFIAHVRARGDLAFRAMIADPDNPSRTQAVPEAIAAIYRPVYAQNGDMFSWRRYNKQKTGLIIRDGKLLHEETYTRVQGVIPPLDELSLYPDGHMEMRLPGEMSAQEYLSRGALDVMAFGPILLSDYVKDSRLDKYYTKIAPRSALGVVGPGHFVGILVEGQNERSTGAGLSFVADRLLEQGCREAFALDGGMSACMLFMGKNVSIPGKYGDFQKARKQQDIIGIGKY